MKATTRDGRRVYHQSTRSYARSRFAWLLRAVAGRNPHRGVVEPHGSITWFHAGKPRTK